MERRIDKMNWREVKETLLKSDTVILPVGTLEAHSVTSNNTDTIIPERIAEMIAPKLESLILPPIPYGVTTSLLPYPGSVDIGESVLSEMILNIAKSCKKDSFKHFIILNGHGGNNNAIESSKKNIYLQTGMFVYVVHWWIFAYPFCEKIFKAEGGHGGVDETAMVLSIDPDLVKTKYLNDENLYFEVSPGISSLPAPSTAILYSRKGGKISVNKRLCRDYHDRVINELATELKKMILSAKRNLT